MVIHLVRHAEAIERAPEIPEEQRYLTQRGRKRFRKVARSLRKSGIKPDVILTSPLVRAVQTAEILAQALKFKGDLVVSALLAHGFLPEELDELLQGFPEARVIALVGHEPEFGEVARTLLGVASTCTLQKGATITFKKEAGKKGADFRQLVEGDATIIDSRSKALKHLNKG